VSDCFSHVSISLAIVGVTVLSIPSNGGPSNQICALERGKRDVQFSGYSCKF